MDMDDINQTTVVAIENKTDSTIFIKWDAPSNPNGLILQFHVEARRVDGDMVSCNYYHRMSITPKHLRKKK